MQSVPSIKQFLVECCDFSESKAERCAGIARLRNCLHINKLYDILQTVEAMQFTNFSFKDIGMYMIILNGLMDFPSGCYSTQYSSSGDASST